MDSKLLKIKNELFYGIKDYTKSQPDIYLPNRYELAAPRQIRGLIEDVIRTTRNQDEILVYVHFPFCYLECKFCNSFPEKTDRDVQKAYVDNLIREIELFSEIGLFQGKHIKHVYFGGGTPTSFDNADLELVLDTLFTKAPLADHGVVSTEAHPVTLKNGKRLAGLKQIGIHRISIGCQTFDQDILQTCNRHHTRDQVKNIIDTAGREGMTTNIDMMIGLPGQGVSSLYKDLEILTDIKPTAVEYIRHEIVNPLVISLYEKQPDFLVGDDELFDMVYTAQSWMDEYGYEQNGRYTSDRFWGFRYWWIKEMPLFAFGSRARSYTREIFYDKYEQIQYYSNFLKKGLAPVGRFFYLTRREQMYRYLFLRLQFKAGVDRQKFKKRFDVDVVDAFQALVDRLKEVECVQESPDRLCLTKYGGYFVEDVCDLIMDFAINEYQEDLVRTPHSTGETSSRIS